MSSLGLRDVPGLQVGHWTDADGATGCTVVLAGDGAVAGVDVRGSAPGTRETDLLRPTALVERVHAVCLAGGSAFGLAAADGVMRWLAERGIGFETGIVPVPIVPAAILFDLGVGRPVWPGPDQGFAACEAAVRSDEPLEGRVGAGAGATVGKLSGLTSAVPGGVGTAGRRLEDGTMVAALAVTNAVGNVVARDGSLLAGSPAPETGPAPPPWGNTTLAVIGTDAPLDRAGCRHLAMLGHDALALSIRPVHTMFDGDVVFALATGSGERPPPERLLALGIAAVESLRDAIERSVTIGR